MNTSIKRARLIPQHKSWRVLDHGLTRTAKWALPTARRSLLAPFLRVDPALNALTMSGQSARVKEMALFLRS